MQKPRRLWYLFLVLLFVGCANAPAAEAPVPQETPAVTAMPTPEPDPAAAGESLLAAGEYADAIDALTRAAEQDPADAARVRRLIDAYTQAETAGAGDYAVQKTAAYETLLRMDAAEPADTLALAALYQQLGRLWDACALLETAQLLHPSDEQQALLEQLVIDTAGMTGGAAETLAALQAHLAGGDTDAAAAILLDDAAYASLVSDIPDTMRRYRSDSADGGVLRVEIARGLPGKEKSSVWYLAADGQTAYLCRDAGTLSVVTAVWADGAYSGAFSSLFLDAQSGSVFTDAGTLQNDLWTGDMTATAALGTEATTLAALWEARTAIPPVTYTGSFDTSGHAQAKQQNNADGIVYAYTEDGKDFLYLTVADAADAYAFGLAELALAPVPVW